MNLYEFIELANIEISTKDETYDEIVKFRFFRTCKNHDVFCNDLMKLVDIVGKDDDYHVVNWSALIIKNIEKFRNFAKEHWFGYWARQYEDDELICQWIKEFNVYLSGSSFGRCAAKKLDDTLYGVLIDFLHTLEPITSHKTNVASLNARDVLNNIGDFTTVESEDNGKIVEKAIKDAVVALDIVEKIKYIVNEKLYNNAGDCDYGNYSTCENALMIKDITELLEAMS